MHTAYQRDSNYPLTVQPRAEGKWEVVNLESSESHGTFDTSAEATQELYTQRDLLAKAIESNKQEDVA